MADVTINLKFNLRETQDSQNKIEAALHNVEKRARRSSVAVSDMSTSFSKVKRSLANLNSTLQQTNLYLNAFSKGFDVTGVIQGLDQIQEKSSVLRDALPEFVGGVATGMFERFFDFLVSGTGKASDEALTKIDLVMRSMAEIGNTRISTDNILQIGQSFDQLLQKQAPTQSFFSSLKASALQTSASITGSLGKSLSDIGQKIKNFQFKRKPLQLGPAPEYNRFEKAFQGLPNLSFSFGDKFRKVFSDVKNGVSNAFDSIKGKLSSLPGFLGKHVENAGGVLSRLSGFFGTAASSAGQLGTSAAGAAPQVASMGTAAGPVGIAIVAVTAIVIGAAVAIYKFSEAAFHLAKSFAEYGVEIGNAAEKTGLAAQTVSALKAQADITGTSFDTVSGALENYKKLVEDASSGNKKAQQTLGQLKTSATDTNGAFKESVAHILSQKTASERLAAATKAFGAEGKNILPFLESFNGDIDGLVKQMDKYGVVVGGENVQASQEMQKALNQLQTQVKGVALAFGEEFLPTVTYVLEEVSFWIENNKEGIASFAEFSGEALDYVVEGFYKLLIAIKVLAAYQQGGAIAASTTYSIESTLEEERLRVKALFTLRSQLWKDGSNMLASEQYNLFKEVSEKGIQALSDGNPRMQAEGRKSIDTLFQTMARASKDNKFQGDMQQDMANLFNKTLAGAQNAGHTSVNRFATGWGNGAQENAPKLQNQTASITKAPNGVIEKNARNSVNTWVNSTNSNILSKTGQIQTGLLKPFDVNSSQLKQAGNQTTQNYFTGVDTKIQQTDLNINQILTDKLTPTIDVAQLGHPVGINYTGGIKQGVIDGFEEVRRTIAAQIELTMSQQPRVQIESRSPSQRSAREIGRPFVQGIVSGFNDERRNLVRTSRKVVEDAVEAAKKQVRKKLGKEVADEFFGAVNALAKSGNQKGFATADLSGIKGLSKKQDEEGVKALSALYLELARLGNTTKEQEVNINLAAGAYGKLNEKVAEALKNAAREIDAREKQSKEAEKLTQKLEDFKSVIDSLGVTSRETPLQELNRFLADKDMTAEIEKRAAAMKMSREEYEKMLKGKAVKEVDDLGAGLTRQLGEIGQTEEARQFTEFLEKIEALENLQIPEGALTSLRQALTLPDGTLNLIELQAKLREILTANNFDPAMIDETIEKLTKAGKLFNETTAATKAAEATDLYTAELDRLNDALSKNIILTERQRLENELTEGKLKGLTEEQKKILRQKQEDLDLKNKLAEQQKQFEEATKKLGDSFNNIFQSLLKGGPRAALKTAFGEIKKVFLDEVNKLVSGLAQSLAKFTMKSLFGGLFGGGKESAANGGGGQNGGTGGQGGGIANQAGGLLQQSGVFGKLLGKIPFIGKLFGGGAKAGVDAAGGAPSGGLSFAKLGAFFSNPWTAVAIGGAIAGFFILKAIFGDKSIKRLREAIQSTYGVMVKDKNVLKQIKQIGEQQLGKGAAAKRPNEVIKLEEAKDLIRAHAEATNQKTDKLGASRADLGNENSAVNRQVAPFGGFRALGGMVRAGMAYVVGERRPELFIPQQNGFIQPQIGGLLNGFVQPQAYGYAGSGGGFQSGFFGPQANGNSNGNSGGGDGLLTLAISQLQETMGRFEAKLQALSPGHVLAMGADENPSVIPDNVLREADSNPGFSDKFLTKTGQKW